VDPATNPYAAPRSDTTGAGDTGEAPLTDDEIQSFVGGNAAYYGKRWARANRRGGSYAGFNWAAALLTSPWLLYRRMYFWFAIVLAVNFVAGPVLMVSLSALHVSGPPQLFLCLSLGLHLPFAFFSNALYLRKARAAVHLARLESEPQRRREVLVHAGGTNVTAVFLGIVAMLLGLMLASAGRTHRGPRTASFRAPIEHATIRA
jgi:hypothetical protein